MVNLLISIKKSKVQKQEKLIFLMSFLVPRAETKPSKQPLTKGRQFFVNQFVIYLIGVQKIRFLDNVCIFFTPFLHPEIWLK